MSKTCSCNEQHAELFGERVVTLVDAVERLRTSMQHSNLAVALQGAEVRQVRVGAVDTKIATSANRLMGWSFRETSGAAAATIYLRDGGDDTAPIVSAIQLAPNESTRDSYFPGGLSLATGLYVDVAAGAVEGAVYLGGANA